MGILTAVCYISASMTGIVFLVFLLVFFIGGCHKMTRKVKGKVTDVYRHDASTDLDDRRPDRDDRIYYRGHYVYEVDGTTYRKYGTISSLSAMTRKMTVWYDPNDPDKASPGAGTTRCLMIVFGALTLVLALVPTIYPLITVA